MQQHWIWPTHRSEMLSDRNTRCVCVCFLLASPPAECFSRYAMTLDLWMPIARAWKQSRPVPPHRLDIFSLIHSKYLKISNRLSNGIHRTSLSRLIRHGGRSASQSGRQGNIVTARCQRSSRWWKPRASQAPLCLLGLFHKYFKRPHLESANTRST